MSQSKRKNHKIVNFAIAEEFTFNVSELMDRKINYNAEGAFNKDRALMLREELERWVKLLKKEYDPDKVILFGSFAQNKVRKWSDIDLIIIKNTEKSFLDRLKEVLVLLRPSVGVDILVYTPEEFKYLSANRSFFKREINSKGKTIYERGN